MAAKKRSKTATQRSPRRGTRKIVKTTLGSTRRGKTGKKRSKRAGSLVLPSLTTLVAAPRKTLQTGLVRYETAIEIKDVPEKSRKKLFTPSGKRRAWGPMKPKGYKAPPLTAEAFIGPVRRVAKVRQAPKAKQKLPADIAYLFK